MKRNMELARLILLAIEQSDDDEPASIQLPTDRYDDLHISLHVRLLYEANLIHAIETTRGFNSSSAWIPHSLTWQGHEFLDVVRLDAIWENLKLEEAKFGGDLPFVVLFDLALNEVRGMVGILDKDPKDKSQKPINWTATPDLVEM
ncbi:MAG: DUF2513 domain-containing protein [Rhizobiaceae bacterium]